MPPYPPVELSETGLLDVGGGNRVYWETGGRPDGKPAVFLLDRCAADRQPRR